MSSPHIVLCVHRRRRLLGAIGATSGLESTSDRHKGQVSWSSSHPVIQLRWYTWEQDTGLQISLFSILKSRRQMGQLVASSLACISILSSPAAHVLTSVGECCRLFERWHCDATRARSINDLRFAPDNLIFAWSCECVPISAAERRSGEAGVNRTSIIDNFDHCREGLWLFLRASTDWQV